MYIYIHTHHLLGNGLSQISIVISRHRLHRPMGPGSPAPCWRWPPQHWPRPAATTPPAELVGKAGEMPWKLGESRFISGDVGDISYTFLEI